ncbi:MAG TPA: phosphate signaling complex protein PhoU [Planctomycetota bacterium]|nr:phosphate signaling complex protein PhoU [Planctomycetota bacterium]
MTKHLQHDLDQLKRDILTMGSMVEEATNKAMAALIQRRPELAEEVIAGDDVIDRKELEVEDKCLKILALHQPVAGDLRFIVGCIKVNNDLERMGDLAHNIAERAAFLSRNEPLEITIDFGRMVERVRSMVSDSLDALVNLDPELAREVCRRDEKVDQYNQQMFARLEAMMKEDPETIERASQTMSVSRHLERIGDHATNIAEDIVYMVEGEIIRHNQDGYPKAATKPARPRPTLS